MKNVNIIGMLLVILLGGNRGFATTEVMESIPSPEQTILENNQEFATTEGVVNISNQMEMINNSLRMKLHTFKSENPRFNYGIRSIEHLYDQGIQIDDIYESEESFPLLRKTICVFRVIAEGACGAIRALSIFHPDDKFVGQVLFGCYIARASLDAAYDNLNKSDNPTDLLLSTLDQVNSDSAFQVSEAINKVQEVDIGPLLAIAKKLVTGVKSWNLSNEEQLKLDRLGMLINKLDESPKARKRITAFCKTISILISTAACISITNTGQKSTASYWLTLLNCGIDPMFQYAEGLSNLNRFLLKKYLRISEMLYICDGFINGWGEIPSVEL